MGLLAYCKLTNLIIVVRQHQVIDYNPNYGEPSIKGDTIRDNDTLATGVVAKTEKLFNDLRIWVKGVTGPF